MKESNSNTNSNAHDRKALAERLLASSGNPQLTKDLLQEMSSDPEVITVHSLDQDIPGLKPGDLKRLVEAALSSNLGENEVMQLESDAPGDLLNGMVMGRYKETVIEVDRSDYEILLHRLQHWLRGEKLVIELLRKNPNHMLAKAPKDKQIAFVAEFNGGAYAIYPGENPDDVLDGLKIQRAMPRN